MLFLVQPFLHTLAGHSQGAALAILAAAFYPTWMGRGASNVGGVYAFAAPRVGDKSFQVLFAFHCRK
jgi:pimeloyl-ACP methyl ester carboxylesterase